MKKFLKSLAASLCIVALMLAMTGCSKKDEAATETPATDAQTETTTTAE